MVALSYLVGLQTHWLQQTVCAPAFRKRLLRTTELRRHGCWAGYVVSICSWAAFSTVYIIELNRYVLKRTWLVRFPIILIFAGELAKLRYGPQFRYPHFVALRSCNKFL